MGPTVHTKIYICCYFSQQYLVLFTMVSRNSAQNEHETLLAVVEPRVSGSGNGTQEQSEMAREAASHVQETSCAVVVVFFMTRYGRESLRVIR